MKEHLNAAMYTAKRSAIREFTALAKATPGCLGLTLGEPDFDTPAPVKAALIEALERGETHYINNSGVLPLREKIAAFERREHGLSYAPEEITVTAGATEALFTALFGVLNPGDEVIIPTPAFVLYEEIVKLCRGVPVLLDTAPAGFQIDGDALAALLTPRTKAIILNTPNNPTGCVYTKQSLESVRAAVKGKRIFVICDDVYRALVYGPGYHSFAEYTDLREQLIVAQSFSKPYAMTGWRMGWLMAPAAVTEHLALLHQYMITSTPAPFQRAAIAALDVDVSGMVNTFRARRDFVLRRLREIGLDFSEPLGAFYVFPSIQKYGLPSAEFCRRMIREAGLAATPGYCFGGEGHIRLSYSYADEVLHEAMLRLERFIQTLERENHGH